MGSINMGQRIKRESRVWNILSHENIMPFMGLCSNIGPSLAMISPLYGNGDVNKYLGVRPEVDRLAIVCSCCHT
jgi:serine/threonine protein kinase